MITLYMHGYYLLTAAVLSIDAFAVGIAYGVRGIRFSAAGRAVFFVTCFCAVLSAVIAGRVLLVFSFGKMLGSLLLAAAGLVMIFQQLGSVKNMPLFEFLAAPEKTDFNNNHIIDSKEALVLALALSVDSSIVCAGSSAGAKGVFLPVCIFLFHQLFLKAGMMTGGRIAADGCERVCGIVAGILLFSLGLDGLLG